MVYATPVQTDKRIFSLDILRGVAVLGILLMNIQSFSMISAAYINPAATGELSGLNKLLWIITHLIADQKFMGMFSILFGAGVILFSASKPGKKAVKLHYKRIGFLLAFGLAHAYLLWHGDILVIYSLCGLWIFLMRKKSPRKLIVTGSILMVVPVLFYMATGYSLDNMPTESVKDIMQSWSPGDDYMSAETRAFRSGWSEQMEFRVPASLEFHTGLFFLFFGWKVSGMMLIGMALFKNGVLSGKRSRKYYIKLAIIGIGTGIILSGIGILKNFEHNWSFGYSMFFGSLFNYVGSVAGSLGYIGLIMLLVNKKFMQFLFQRTGQMAFTNYLLQTIICTFIFYGHGLGLFGEVSRLEQLGIVLMVWVLLILLSRAWLKYFKYGPFEWLWRMLTYGKVLMITKQKPNSQK